MLTNGCCAPLLAAGGWRLAAAGCYRRNYGPSSQHPMAEWERRHPPPPDGRLNEKWMGLWHRDDLAGLPLQP